MTDRTDQYTGTDERWSASSLLFFSAYLLTIAHALLPHMVLDSLANGCMLAFIVIEYRRTEIIPKIMSALLLVVGLVAASTVGNAWHDLWEGLSRTRVFLVLFGAVAWLAVPAKESPSLRAIREMVLTQPPGRRFAYLGMAAHGLGLAFNLAGISLLSGMINDKHPPRLRRRLGRAMAQGFALVTCWSPFFVGAVVILGAWPEFKWSEIAPFGICLAVALWGLSWGMDKMTNPRPTSDAARKAPSTVSGLAWLRTAGVLSVLFAAVIFLVEGQGISIPVALGIVAPPLALIWRASFYSAPERAKESTGFAYRTIAGLKNIRGEIVLFTAANTMGLGLSDVINPEQIAAFVSGLGYAPLVMMILLCYSYLALGALGLHPVITVVLLSQFLTAEMLGVSPTVMILTLMALWGMGTNISPTSATVMYISRLTRENNLTVAWRWNGPFSVAGGTVIAVLGTAVSYLGLV